MRLSDLTTLDGAKGVFTKLIGALFVVLVAGNLVCTAVARLSTLQALGLFALFLAQSPLAYFIRERRRPPRPERPRAGAERTPVLPPTEDDE